jgi:pimeloyl-ACP methyl ester carboxylesterase
MPIEIWHGEDDRVVSPQQSRILAGTLKHARVHFVPGEGHFSLFASHAEAILQAVARG